VKNKVLVLLLILFVIINADTKSINNKPTTVTNRKVMKSITIVDKKNSFKKFRLGAPLTELSFLRKVRPSHPAHIEGDEIGLQFYGLPKSIFIGDYEIKNSDIYFVFYKKKLFRIRIINQFSGKNGRDLDYFRSMLTALTVKYGSVKSIEPIWSRFNGKYVWKTDKIKVMLRYEYLEYTHLGLEKIRAKELKTDKKIRSADI